MGCTRLAAAAIVCLICAASPAGAASHPCRNPFLNAVERLMCQDPQLSKADDETARKVDALRPRLSYGQYLGLRYWQSLGAEAREQCGMDRTCRAAQYRAQNRVLDGLQLCLDGGTRRRVCWRVLMEGGGSLAQPR